jgi:hypothetical protein
MVWWEGCVEGMVELVDLPWGRGGPPGFRFEWTTNEGRMMWMTSQHQIVKPPQARAYAQLLSNFRVQHSLEFSISNVMNIQPFMDKLNKMSISNVKRQKILTFVIWWRHHHGTVYCVTLWAYFLNIKHAFIPIHLGCVYNTTFFIKYMYTVY